jgi:hypothetical protein
MQFVSSVLFFGIIIWVFWMMTFRPKQFMELNNHAKQHRKDVLRGAGKGVGVGLKVLGMFLKR